MQEHRFSRRVRQALSVLSLALGTLFLIGLCENVIVLPFVNLSGATSSVEENLFPALEKPADLAGTPKLSFLQMLDRFGEQADEGAERSAELYDAGSTIVLSAVDSALLPTVGTVEGKPALEARQGFLIRHSAGGVRTLMDADGRVLLEEMPAQMDLTGHWDASERAVFTSAEGYVVYNASTGAFEEADYVRELYAVTGVDLPVYYNRPDSRIALSYKNGKYGYYYSDTGKPNYQYTHSYQSYQFRDGYGALGTENGVIIVDPTASRAFFTYGTFLQPAGEGEELLGYYRFEYGLMRVSRLNESGEREDLVLTHSGQVFYLPRDFTIVSYSDGVFLLEKDGRFGYMDYTGRWITDPVFQEAAPFCEGLAVVRGADGKAGVIDRDGTFVIPCEFDLITGSSGGVMTLCSGSRWVVVQKVK